MISPQLVLLPLLFTVFLPLRTDSAPWRSTLYPIDWQPGFADPQGRFLHDFSYAGYHRGERPLPLRKNNVIDVTKPPYSADATGVRDATKAIQSAIDAAGEAGGGVVFLPTGTYRIAPEGANNAALKFQKDNVVIRGEGPDKTFLFNDTVMMRNKSVIEVKPKDFAWWYAEGKWAKKTAATADIPTGATRIPLQDTAPFSKGDLIVVRNELTDRFIEELGMTGKWTRENRPNGALIFCRRVVSVDSDAITIDVPTRYLLRKEDNAHVVRLTGRMVMEVGLEDLSIGMKEHSASTFGDHDYLTEGLPAHDVHQSFTILVESAENCWIRNVNSYCPSGNTKGYQVLSNGIKLTRSRFVNVENCIWSTAQYQGGGGNGYLFTLCGSECLVRNCSAEAGRHNYDFHYTSATGNVILDSITKKGQLASDFHMYFSVANLLDNVTCDTDFLEAVYRPYGSPIHGVTTSQSVFWNTHGVSYPARKKIIVESRQFGDGYVIGTRGLANAVDSDDFVEGVGQGDTLEPRSLYLDQLSRRLGTSKASENLPAFTGR